MSATFFQRLGRVVSVLRRLPSKCWEWELRWRGVQMEGPVLFLGRPIVSVAPGSRMILQGENRIFSSVRCNLLANFQPALLRTIAPNATLQLGRGVGLSGAGVCAASSIIIGDGTIIGTGALIFDTDFHDPAGDFGWEDDALKTARPITIGRGCFIGARAIIMKGVTMGDRSAAAAGAVVTRKVPSGMVAVGNPAQNWPWKGAAAT